MALRNERSGDVLISIAENAPDGNPAIKKRQSVIGKGLRPGSKDKQRRQRKQNPAPNAIDQQNKLAELQNKFEEERASRNQLEDRIEVMQDRYIRREQEYRKTITEYEKEINETGNISQVELDDSSLKNIDDLR